MTDENASIKDLTTDDNLARISDGTKESVSALDKEKIPDPDKRQEIVLKLLDSEINQISADLTRQGLTVWALLVALAGIIWGIFSINEAGKAKWDNYIQIFLILCLMAEIGSTIYSQLTNRSGSQSNTPRYYWYGQFIEKFQNRASLFFLTLQSVASVIITIVTVSPIPLIYVWLTRIYYIVRGLMTVFVFILSYFHLPLKTSSTNTLIGKIVIYILSIIGFCGSLGYALALKSSITAPDFRMGILLTAAIFLVYLLINKAEVPPLLSSLIEIRRELAFGRVETGVAIKQIEITFVGMQASDVLQDDVRRVIDCLDRISQQVDIIEKKLNSLKASLPAEDPALTEAHVQLIISVSESAKPYRSKAIEIVGELQAIIDKISQRLRFMNLSTEESDIVASLFSKTESLNQACVEKIKQVEAGYNHLLDRAEQAAQEHKSATK